MTRYYEVAQYYFWLHPVLCLVFGFSLIAVVLMCLEAKRQHDDFVDDDGEEGE